MVATRLFHVTGEAATYHASGSGDTALQYVMVFLSLVAAVGGTLVWSLLDRKRGDYVILHSWLRLGVRYFLALVLLSYGFAKVFPMQFSENSLFWLSQEYGSFSPMGIVWSFMGTSRAYTFFGGSAEVLGGLLLFFRRTTSLGAMVTFGVMSNVVALNYCYDIPVKLHSTHYLVMAAFLLAPDAHRLVKVLLFNQATEPADLRFPVFKPGWQLWTSRVIWTLVVFAGGICGPLYLLWNTSPPKPRPPLYGLYVVEGETQDGWWKVIMESPGNVTIRMRDGKVRYLSAKYDTAKRVITLNKNADYRWETPEPKILVLTGPFNGKETAIRLRRIDETLPLLTRGFHWVQEYPFNR